MSARNMVVLLSTLGAMVFAAEVVLRKPSSSPTPPPPRVEAVAAPRPIPLATVVSAPELPVPPPVLPPAPLPHLLPEPPAPPPDASRALANDRAEIARLQQELQVLRARSAQLEQQVAALEDASRQNAKVVEELQALRTQFAQDVAERQASKVQAAQHAKDVDEAIASLQAIDRQLLIGDTNVEAALDLAERVLKSPARTDVAAIRFAIANKDLAGARAYLQQAIIDAQTSH